MHYDNVGNVFETLDFTGLKGNNGINSIAVDSAGGLYLADRFTGTADLDPGPGKAIVTSKGKTDFFLVHTLPGDQVAQDLQEPTLKQAFAFGANGGVTHGDGVVTDAAGNIYVAGLFNKTVDFDPGPGVTNLTSTDPDGNVFIAKYTAGGALLWAQQVQMNLTFDANAPDEAIKLALDDAGNP